MTSFEENNQEMGILITGEGVASVDKEKIKAALTIVDIRGIDVQIVPVSELVANLQETETPILGYATYEDLVDFATTRPEYSEFGYPSRLWTSLISQTVTWCKPKELKAGEVYLGEQGHTAQLMHNASPIHEDPMEREYHRRLSDPNLTQEYRINLDTLSALVTSKEIKYFYHLGKKVAQFAQDFVELRQTQS